MTSRLVLGAATFGKLTQSEVNTLIGTAQECGITRIDTAHGYERSEEKVGVFLKKNDNFQINTKVGLPDRSNFTPKGIKSSVEESLRRLGIERITTLFVHSLETEYLSDENISAMTKLKEQGKVQRIGYAGDGDNLRSAVGIAAFDDFMATYSIIDQAKSNNIKKASCESVIYYKLALGQAVWTSLEWKRRLKSRKIVRFLFNKPPVPESWTDYCLRFNSFRSEIDSKDFAATFLRFALFSGTAKQLVILGTNNQQHIRDAIKVEQNRINLVLSEIRKYEDLWLQKSRPEWHAHVG